MYSMYSLGMVSDRVFVPVEDECRLCAGRIWWAEGGLFWYHVTLDADHEAVPATRTDLQDFAGCRLHGDSEQWWICTCNNT